MCAQLWCTQLGVLRFELSYLPRGAPTVIAIPRIPEIGVGERLEATRGIKAPGYLIGERLIMDKAVRARRADGLFVKPLGIRLPALDPRNLRPHQRGAILEILRTVVRPYLKLFVVDFESIEVLSALVCRFRIAARCMGKRTVKFIFGHVKSWRSRKQRPGLQGGLDG